MPDCAAGLQARITRGARGTIEVYDNLRMMSADGPVLMSSMRTPLLLGFDSTF
jgi:hypothetical protein